MQPSKNKHEGTLGKARDVPLNELDRWASSRTTILQNVDKPLLDTKPQANNLDLTSPRS